MFAIAIWDNLEEKLYLIRDRIGIKPLYYYLKGEDFFFSSELKSFCFDGMDKTKDRNAISNFLYLGYIPGEATIYKYCKKLKPGHYAIWDKGQFTVFPYWKIEDKILKETISDEVSAKNTLKGLLKSSVRYCMISDVPIGVLLSGGVDSSLVTAIAQSFSEQPVQTFSIGFTDKKYNESEFAANVAKYIGTNHHEYQVTECDALRLVEKILDIYDEPYADSSAIPTLIVSELARKNVTVVLTGDGGDELFMGYGFYYWARRMQNPWLSTFRKPLANALHTFGNNRMQRGSKVFNYLSQARIKSHIFSQEQYYFTEREIDDLLICPAAINIDEKIYSTVRNFNLPEQQSFFDIKNYLPEELLVKADRASMHYSLEMRVPLLDYRLVEFALNLSPDLKLNGNTGKYLLKQVLYDYIPETFFNRPKRGFSVPLAAWLRTDLKYLIDTWLSPSIVAQCGIVFPENVEKLKAAFFRGKHYLYNRLWALILLHKWLIEKG